MILNYIFEFFVIFLSPTERKLLTFSPNVKIKVTVMLDDEINQNLFFHSTLKKTLQTSVCNEMKIFILIQVQNEVSF